MMAGNAFVAIFLASLAGTHAFVNLTPLNPSCSRTSPAAFKMTMDAAESVTRSEAIQRAAVGSGVLAAGVLLAPLRQGEAGAEELKDESEQFGELRGNLEKKGKLEQVQESSSVLTEATTGLKTLDFFIGEKDYMSLRQAMRKPPIVYLRSSANKVITNLDDELQAKNVKSAYKELITSVDKLDSLAIQGMREKGGLKDNKEIMEVYGACVERGSALVTLLPASK